MASSTVQHSTISSRLSPCEDIIYDEETCAAKLQRTQEWIVTQPDTPSDTTTIAQKSTKKEEIGRLLNEELSTKRRTWHGRSFDSQDSACTRQTFRIAAGDQFDGVSSSTPRSAAVDIVAQEKLGIAGILDAITEVMRQLHLPAEQRTSRLALHRGALAHAVGDVDLMVVVSKLISDVSNEIQSKSFKSIRDKTQKRRDLIAAHERLLAFMRKEAAQKLPEPLIVQWTERKQTLGNKLQMLSKELDDLKRELANVAEQKSSLEEMESNADVVRRQLHEYHTKYRDVCQDNCVLNKTVQKLQGSVRCFCRLPTTPCHESYLQMTNRGELTLSRKKKDRTYSLDAIFSGSLNRTHVDRDLRPLAISALDGNPIKCKQHLPEEAVAVGMDLSFTTLGMNCNEDSTCFGELIPFFLDMLISVTEDRVYHASYSLDYELFFVSDNKRLQIVPRMPLTTALEAPKGSLESRRTRIRSLLTDHLSCSDYLHNYEQRHFVVKIHIQSRPRINDDQCLGTTSTMTFIRHQSSSDRNCFDDGEITRMASTLEEISARGSSSPKSFDSLLLEEIAGQCNRPKLHVLLMDLKNRPGNERADIAGLELCSRIIAARAFPMDEKALARKKVERKLKEEVTKKNHQISELEQERSDLVHRNKALCSDIQSLRSEIDDLTVIYTPLFALNRSDVRPVIGTDSAIQDTTTRENEQTTNSPSSKFCIPPTSMSPQKGQKEVRDNCCWMLKCRNAAVVNVKMREGQRDALDCWNS